MWIVALNPSFVVARRSPLLFMDGAAPASRQLNVDVKAILNLFYFERARLVSSIGFYLLLYLKDRKQRYFSALIFMLL